MGCLWCCPTHDLEVCLIIPEDVICYYGYNFGLNSYFIFLIIRSLGYRDDTEKKPSPAEMVGVQATAGMVAGACSSVLTTPIDTVKTRLQVQ